MILRKLTVAELYELESRINTKQERHSDEWFRNPRMRMGRVKDRVGVHLNRRLFNGEYEGAKND